MYGKPVVTQSRCAFSLAWYATEKEAEAAAEAVRAAGRRYNGGFCDGMRCGRETAHDYENSFGKFYAVSY